jgi:mRNA interferase RelE/StbE
MYALLVKSSAERDLRKLPRSTLERINAKLLTLSDEPRPPGSHKLSGNLEGWRVRVGDYRILYQTDDTGETITVVRVRHRRDVYR